MGSLVKNQCVTVILRSEATKNLATLTNRSKRSDVQRAFQARIPQKARTRF
jgi:hypothetical protein